MKRFIIVFAVCIVLLFVLFQFVLFVSCISSGSMEPTLMTGDIEIGNRLAYIKHTPQRGDIIIFNSRENNAFMGKRVIGISGDHIEFHDGYVYLNGELLDESTYIAEDVETNCVDTFVVPEGCVFVLGDNRENSADSRVWDNPYIEIADIEGKHMISIPLVW